MLVGYLALFVAAGTSVAAPPGQRVGPVPKAASPAHPAVHNQASSFAPHPTQRRTFGAPIQGQIMKHVAPTKKKKPAPK
jgi:hypothetical protein